MPFMCYVFIFVAVYECVYILLLNLKVTGKYKARQGNIVSSTWQPRLTDAKRNKEQEVEKVVVLYP